MVWQKRHHKRLLVLIPLVIVPSPKPILHFYACKSSIFYVAFIHLLRYLGAPLRVSLTLGTAQVALKTSRVRASFAQREADAPLGVVWGLGCGV